MRCVCRISFVPAHCADKRLQILQKKEADWRFNRDLYLAVGERWSWIDKRPWTDEQWKEYGLAPELRTFGAYYGDSLAGYYELRRDNEGGVEIAYFGLLPEFFGRGFGGALLTSAIEEAWRMSPSISRFGSIPAHAIMRGRWPTTRPEEWRSTR